MQPLLPPFWLGTGGPGAVRLTGDNPNVTVSLDNVTFTATTATITETSVGDTFVAVSNNLTLSDNATVELFRGPNENQRRLRFGGVNTLGGSGAVVSLLFLRHQVLFCRFGFQVFHPFLR